MSKDLVKYEKKDDMSQAGIMYQHDVENLRITSRDTYAEMVNLVRVSKQYQGAVKNFFEKMRQKTYDAYTEVTTQIREYSAPFIRAENIGKQRMKGWEQIEAERQRKAEAKQRAEIAAAEAKQKAAEKEAAAKGEPLPVPAPAPVFVPVVNKAKVAGVTYVDNWKGEVTDFDALLKAILAGKAPKRFVYVNNSEVNKFGNATKGRVAVPGVDWHNDKITRVGK